MGETKKLLDHGYLTLVEAWGSESGIIEAARMSTGKGFLGWGPFCSKCGAPTVPTPGGPSPRNYESGKQKGCQHDADKAGDEKLLRFLYENQHCYDAETEVLSRHRGFVRWGEVTRDDELGQWDAAADSLVYERPLELVRRQHRGRMYRVEHGGVDLLVTDNHRMLVKRIVSVLGENRQEWAPEWSLVAASELEHKAMVRYRKHAARTAVEDVDLCSGKVAPIFPEHADGRALLRLIGFFIGDGHAGGTRTNAVVFHLRKARKIAFLREVCCEVGWELSEQASDNYVVRAEGLGRFFRGQFYDGEARKCVPSYLLGLNAGDAAALLDGLRASNGSTKRGAWEYFSTSRQVAEAVQRLVLHAGGAAHVHHSEAISRVMVLSRMLEPVINQGKRNTSWVEDFEGPVFCAHTRTGVLVVRRNGKIVLSGNSTPFEMAGATFEVAAPIMVFREWHRHRVPFGYNEMSARYTPLPDVNYVPTVERMMIGSDGKNRQAGTVTGARALTEAAAIDLIAEEREFLAAAERFYQKKLSAGVPKELARTHVGVSRYSRMRATANLRGWLGFLTLRTAPNAQWEIRQYADALHDLLEVSFPRTMELFDERRAASRLAVQPGPRDEDAMAAARRIVMGMDHDPDLVGTIEAALTAAARRGAP